jgi:hypothetical protein
MRLALLLGFVASAFAGCVFVPVRGYGPGYYYGHGYYHGHDYHGYGYYRRDPRRWG